MRRWVTAAALAAALVGCKGYDQADNATTGTDRPGPTGFVGVTGFPIENWGGGSHRELLRERTAEQPAVPNWSLAEHLRPLRY